MLNSEITQKCNEIGTLLFCGPPPRTRGQKRRARTHKLVFRTNNALSGLATTSFDTCCLVPIGSYPRLCRWLVTESQFLKMPFFPLTDNS